MGNKSSFQNPILEEWNAHPRYVQVFYNEKTKQFVKRDVAVISEEEEQTLEKRMHQSHSYITKVEYYQVLEVLKGARKKKYQVFTDAIHPIGTNSWVRIDTALTVLRAFRRLSNSYGFFSVSEKMIRTNHRSEVKIWINSNPAAYQIEQFVDSQESMLAEITQIMMKYDSDTAVFMMGCKTFNQCMNSILMSLSKNRIQPHLSMRTVIHDNFHKKSPHPTNQEHKNIFRSTKETEDQFPHLNHEEAFYDMSYRINSSNSPQISCINPGSLNKNCSPIYDRRFISYRAERSPKKQINYNFNDIKNQDKKGQNKPLASQSISKYKSLCGTSIQLQTSILMNQTQGKNEMRKNEMGKNEMGKNEMGKKNENRQKRSPYIKNKHHFIIPHSNSNAFLNSYSPKATFTYNNLQKSAVHLKSDAVRQENSATQSQKKSQFSKTSCLTVTEQVKPKKDNYRQNGSPLVFHNKQKWIKKTKSGDFQASQNLQFLRNRTQDFFHPGNQGKQKKTWSNNNSHQNRCVTKQIHEFQQINEDFNKKDEKKMENQKSARFFKAIEQKNSYIYEKNDRKKQLNQILLIGNQEKNKGDEEKRHNEKKQMKQMLARKIKEELGSMLNPNNMEETDEILDEKDLKKDKSNRDLMIKKKVAEKKKNFASLKSEALKLLIG